MISIENLHYHHPGTENGLGNISLTLAPGGVLLLAGANGSGKSTLLQLLCGLLTPGKGSIRIGDLESPGMEKRIRSRVGLVFQDPGVQILGATVSEDLLPGTRAWKAGEETGHELADRFGLRDLWDRPVQDLSGGEKRRLCLASALVSGPEVLLMDEPLSGLDYPGIRELRSLIIRNRERGLTQVISTHDLEPLTDLADSLAVLHQGALVCIGKPTEVMDGIEVFGIRPPCSWQREGIITEWQ